MIGEKKDEKILFKTKIFILIIEIIVVGIIAFIFFGVSKVNALTPVEANFNYDNNGNSISYNIRPDGGTTGFIYDNEFFGQEISHSSYRQYKLPGSTFKTTNINGYFANPCGSGQDISYTMKINFYKQPSDTNTMAWVRVVNGIDGCTGYFEVINGVYIYNNVCNLSSGDVPKFSLYFDESPNGLTYYRVGIPVNFSYTCSVGNQAIIDSNNANTNKIIENENKNFNTWMSRKEEMFAMEEEDREEEKGLLQNILNAISNIFSDSVDDPTNDLNGLSNNMSENNVISSLLLLPVSIFQKVINSINGTCQTFTLGVLLDHTLTMPCIHIDSILGSALYGVIDVILSGFLIYHIRNKLVKIWENLTSLKTGGNELE